MFAMQLRAAITVAPRDHLFDLAAALWKAFAAGAVTEAEAGELSLLIEARKAPGLGAAGKAAQEAVRGQGALPASLPRPASPRLPTAGSAQNQERMARCRRWAAAGRMPPAIACKFTQGEQAALAVIAVEVTKRNTCSLAIGAIAALAGVSESTVKRAIRQAKALGFVTVQERRLSRFRNDTNIIRIIAKAWRSWIEMRSAGGGVQRRTGMITSDPSRQKMRRQEPFKRASERSGHEAEPIQLTAGLRR